MSKNIYSKIKTILLTEKTSFVQERNNDFVFKVDKKANKKEIREAIEKIFNVNVVNIRTLNVSGKIRRKRRPDQGMTASWKKAYVRLAESDTIDLV